VGKPIDLAAALAAVDEQPAQALTLRELFHAHALVTLDGSDTRLKKWAAAFGATSAWEVSSEQLESAARAMFEHGYKPSAINRDLSAMGSAYRWAKAKRLSPKGFRSPTLGVTRFEEAIQALDVYLRQRYTFGGSDCHVVIVHHSGHTAGRERGSTAFSGAMDQRFEVKRFGDEVEFINKKMKDADEPPTIKFTLVKDIFLGEVDGNAVMGAALKLSGSLLAATAVDAKTGPITVRQFLEAVAAEKVPGIAQNPEEAQRQCHPGGIRSKRVSAASR
jgi:hypothetical protein